MNERLEDGGATTEVTVVVPAAILLVFLTVQFALWLHASHVVTAAAQHGLSRLEAERGSSSEAALEARRFLGAAGGGVVLSPSIEVERSSDAARVAVAGSAVTVIPGLHLPVRALAVGPVERFRASGER